MNRHIDDYPAIHVEQARDYERRLLSSGFHFPVLLNNAAYRIGLCGADFGFPEHSWLFAILCTAAENDVRLTLDDLHELNRRARDPFSVEFNPSELQELVEEDVLDTDVDRWAGAVKSLADRRRRAGELVRRAKDLVAEPFVPGGASPKRKAAVVSHRRSRRHAYAG